MNRTAVSTRLATLPITTARKARMKKMPIISGSQRELAEVAFEQRAHANVMVERVDLSQIVPRGSVASGKRIRIDVKIQAVLKLVRKQGHVPERKEEGRNEQQRRH